MRARRALSLLTSATVLAGCAAAPAPASAAEAIAALFVNVRAKRDGTAACTLLMPRTAQRLAETSGAPCPVAILEEQLPPAGPVRSSAADGLRARVVFAGDVVFLAQSTGAWRVAAAGCRTTEEHPDACQLAE